MKVVFIYRKPYNEAYSIEVLFNSIAREMSKYVDVAQYTLGGYSQTLWDVYKLRQLRGDIYHITGDVNYIAAFLPRKKTVLTVHDIIYYLYSLTGAKRWLYKLFWLIIPFLYVKHITTVSQLTKQDLVTFLNITPKKITVIPNCYNPIFRPIHKSFNAACPTIFQIGSFPHKNVIRLIEALRGLQCNLVIIGKLDSKTIQKLEECQIKYSNYVGITTDQIYQLYASSDILTFVSLNEGFGMPIIEAQAVGRAVITSNSVPMCIVAGNGACLVNPLKTEEIRQGILKIINEPAYRESLISNGFNNIKHYSAQKITGLYLNYYHKTGLLANWGDK